MHFKNAIAFAAITTLFAMPAIAQDDEVQISNKYDVELGKPYPVIDGVKRYFEADASVICIKNDGKRWFVQKLSADGLTQTSMQQYEDFPKDMEIEYIGYFGKRLLVFYSLWDKSNEREQLFYREVDINEGRFMGKGTKLLSVNGKVSGSMAASGFYRFHVTDKFDFIFSADDEHLVVQWVKKRDKKDDSKDYRLSVAVFNNALDQQWTADIKMPYAAADMDMKDYTIDSKGDICIIATVYQGSEEKQRKREDGDWKYHFLRCTQQGAGWETTPLEITGRQLMSLSLFETADGTLHAGGFYRKDREQRGADGFFLCGFSGKDEMTNLAFHEIPTEVINAYATKRELKRNKKEEDKGEDLSLFAMELVRVIMNDGGGMLLVGEQRYTTVECTTDSRGNTRCYTVWHADDLLVCDMDAQGNLHWMKRLPKQESSRAPIGSSFKFMYGGGAYHFVHFGYKSNIDLNGDGVRKNKGDRYVVADRIEESTGSLTREALLNPDEVKGMKLYQLAMDRLVRTKDNELLMEAYKKQKQDILVRIAVKE